MGDVCPSGVRLTRRSFGVAAAAAAATAALPGAAAAGSGDLTARPPAGFTPLSVPGRVVRVTKGTSASDLMQPNGLWPRPEVARLLLERSMMELTGASNLIEAMKRFISPDDVVAVKVNGIAGMAMAVNYELILPVVEAVLAVGVPAENVTVFEQYPNFLSSTRVNIRGNKLRDGVRVKFHANNLADMSEVRVFENVPTKYVRFLTAATAVINMSLIKDHSICGYTGALKNITHGCIINPHDHHRHQADPQIAELFAHPIPRSRMRLHITDGFKMIYDEGPLDKNPRRRILHGGVYVSTDPVAMDTVGWQVIDEARRQNRLKSLAEVRREPKYIRSAAALGLGEANASAIRLSAVTL